MTNEEKNNLYATAWRIRRGVIEGVYRAQSGHPGGSLSISDILTYLYFKELRIDPKNPRDEKRDRFVLSKGHCAPALYATLAERGFFDKAELQNLRQVGSFLQGHPEMKHTPGVDMSTGSLGQGISAACGIAKAAKITGQDYRVYTVLGDGELQEGQVWEAAMFAAQQKLDNLCVIVDNNGLQIDGSIDEICSPRPIDKKFEAFGFNVIIIDAHDMQAIEDAFLAAKGQKNRPTAIIAVSIKGRGVSYMENNAAWHGSAPNEEQYGMAVRELEDKLHTLSK